MQVLAQIPDSIKAGLQTGTVVTYDGYIYSQTTSTLRNPVTMAEAKLVTIATNNIAKWLCNYTPSTNKKLETEITGVSLISTIEKEKSLTIVVRVPQQIPVCNLIEKTNNFLESNLILQSNEEKSILDDIDQVKLKNESYMKQNSIQVRTMKGEY